MTFATHPCFAPGIIGCFTRGEACHRLSDAAAKFPEAAEARLSLGDSHDPVRRARALALLEALPERMRVVILAGARSA